MEADDYLYTKELNSYEQEDEPENFDMNAVAVANYDIDFNFEGFKHGELIDRNLNMQCFL